MPKGRWCSYILIWAAIFMFATVMMYRSPNGGPAARVLAICGMVASAIAFFSAARELLKKK